MKQTLLNLTKGFLGESQARNRYTLYANVAKKEGYIQIANIFLETAEHERQHSKRFFTMLQELKEKEGITDDMIEVPSTAAVKYGDTMTNLKTAMEGEHEEYSDLYPEFARVAEEEGYPEFAKRIRSIIVAEIHHEERYKKLYEQLEKETIWNKEEVITWVCTECGYTHKGKNPPELCPSCDHPIGYYIRKCEEY
ncbi:MAG TPA: rubrerythrin family protein [Candidatus Absconditabacterales bacterium]|nr:rubrerythrin family protein [Candidatus Absconditabacterales bacterium]HPC34431.1 rubrerythrin family protein [Candidatus Absconditabacterales bacterium]HPK28083.1 rubrerythrin family protein [Candidatus Absconditabacterales bacterium]